MRINRKWIAAAALVGFSVVGVGLWAQDGQPVGRRTSTSITPLVSRALTRDDIGIRVTTQNGRIEVWNDGHDFVNGQLLVRIDGQWVDLRLR
jgi:hypothetical protein